MKFIEICLRVFIIGSATIIYIGTVWFMNQRSTMDNFALFALLTTLILNTFGFVKNLFSYTLFVIGLLLLIYNLYRNNLSINYISGLLYGGIFVSLGFLLIRRNGAQGSFATLKPHLRYLWYYYLRQQPFFKSTVTRSHVARLRKNSSFLHSHPQTYR